MHRRYHQLFDAEFLVQYSTTSGSLYTLDLTRAQGGWRVGFCLNFQCTTKSYIVDNTFNLALSLATMGSRRVCLWNGRSVHAASPLFHAAGAFTLLSHPRSERRAIFSARHCDASRTALSGFVTPSSSVARFHAYQRPSCRRVCNGTTGTTSAIDGRPVVSHRLTRRLA